MRGKNNLLKKKGYSEIYDLLQNHSEGMTTQEIRRELPHLTSAVIGGACTRMYEFGVIRRITHIHGTDGCRHVLWGPWQN